MLFNEASLVSENSFDKIENFLKIRLQSRADVFGITKMETQCKNIVDTTEISMPIIAHLKDYKESAKHFSSVKIRKYLRMKLMDRNDLMLIQECHKGQFICGNLSTLEWLRSTVNVFSQYASIGSWTQLVADDFKEIIFLSPARLPKKTLFNVYMASIQTAYPNLRTNLWKFQYTESDWKWYINADIQSIAYLEQDWKFKD